MQVSDFFDEQGTGSRVDLPLLLDTFAGPTLQRLVAAGALVSVSLSRDGGAFAVTVTSNGRWRREWFRDEGELSLWLDQAAGAVEAVGATRPASSGRGSGPRSLRTA